MRKKKNRHSKYHCSERSKMATLGLEIMQIVTFSNGPVYGEVKKLKKYEKVKV